MIGHSVRAIIFPYIVHCLDTPERAQRNQNLQEENVKLRRQVKSLKDKLTRSYRINGVCLQGDLQDDIINLVQKYSSINTEDGENDDESFKSIFWKQQINNLSLKNKRQIRWHPLIIRWALYLHHSPRKSYEMLRNSGVITLPSTRTLCDYRHFAPTESGFSIIADMQLLESLKLKPSLAKYVIILIDEMYVKEGLVYDKSSGALIG